MDKSILITMRKLLVGGEDDTSFDADLLIHINSVINILYQLGLNFEELVVKDEKSKWDDLIDDNSLLEIVKTYMYLKIRKVFDPPQSATAMEALNSSINELEWRLNVTVDPESEDN